MNKAVPWNINGVGFDAREAAREAARRQGKSLGAWLHGVIADHAAELGVEAHDVADQERIDAITTRLERLSGRAADADRRDRMDRAEGPVRARVPRRAIEQDDETPRPRRATQRRDEDAPGEPRRVRRSTIEETEFLLEEAVDAMERRAARSERRTDTALDSFAKLLENNEARRDAERSLLRELTEKLSGIEAKLGDGSSGSGEGTLVNGALARLEARLETMAARSAETKTRLQAAPGTERRADAEPIRRLEDKLNSILDVVAARAPAASLRPVSNRRLGDAIAEISRRQKSLEDPDAAMLVAPRRTRPILVREPQDDAPWQQSLSAIQAEIGSLATQIESMRRDVALHRAGPSAGPVDVEGLRAEIGGMSQSLRELSPRGTVTPLKDSIEALTRSVENSRHQGVHDTVLHPVEAVIGDLRNSLADIDPRPTLGLLERDVHAIARKLDGFSDAHAPALARIQDQMQEIRDLLSTTAARPLAVEQIERQVAALADQMKAVGNQPNAGRDLGTAADDIRALLANPPGTRALEKIEGRLESLAMKLDDAINPGLETNKDVAGIERLVRDLTAKIEAARAPHADNQAIEALQRQVELLAARFERSETGLASLSKLERSMQELFQHLDETRATVETSAAEAAREVLRIAADDGRAPKARAEAPDVAALKALQIESDGRTQSTLNAVHQTLEHVVGRMSAMEADIKQVRRPAANTAATTKPTPSQTPSTPKPSRPKAPPDMSLDSVERILDPLPQGKPTGERAANAAPGKVRPKMPSLDEDAGRADFIAAARRAAQAAQTDSSVAGLAKTPAARATDTRAGLVAKSRDYVSSHKRPVLLSVAAVFVVLGTMAVMQRMTFDGADPQIALAHVPAKIAATADATRAPTSNQASLAPTEGDLSPSALPKSARALAAQIPGSDPIQTSSIQALPSFAAQGQSLAPAPTARPALSSGLVTMANAGDGAAEYELASAYADGKLVPRDFRLAAGWYEKAAQQGLAPAEYRLAALYEKGLGVAPDKRKARGLYQRAADAGNPRAMHNLAVLLADGDGKPDYAGAATWFRKAAQYGVHDSQYNLAILLARGLGVDQSLVQSYQWFAIAAGHNDADAAKKRDEVGDKMSANDLAVAKALAASFQPRTTNPAAVEVAPPPGGWDSLGAASHINSARSKISSL